MLVLPSGKGQRQHRDVILLAKCLCGLRNLLRASCRNGGSAFETEEFAVFVLGFDNAVCE
jgi:hypothetical protein